MATKFRLTTQTTDIQNTRNAACNSFATNLDIRKENKSIIEVITMIGILFQM